MTISVCIPTYNQAQFLEKAIRSAYNQTYPISEIIVSDDASTDGTLEVLDRLQHEIDSLKIIRNANNNGITANVNIALKAATSDLVIRLDSDDCLQPDFAISFVKYFENNSELGYGHAAVQEINQFDEPTRQRVLHRSTGIQSSSEALKAAAKGYRVAANIVIFKREALEAVGFITTTINFAEDYYLTSAISAQGYANIYINTILSQYRVWTDVKHARSRRKLAEIEGLYAVFNEVLIPTYKRLDWSTEKLHAQLRTLAFRHADCLGWDIYSSKEKATILARLQVMNNGGIANIVYRINSVGLGWLLIIPKTAIFNCKQFMKLIIKNFRLA